MENNSVTGQWMGKLNNPGDSMVKGDGKGFFVIHAVLLNTGNLLLYSGPVAGGAGGAAHFLSESHVYDVKNDRCSNLSPRDFPRKNGMPINIFCGFHTLLEDGRVVTVGGSEHDIPNTGINAICVFDPKTERWEKIGEMKNRRWYPTAVVLPSGRIAVFSGYVQGSETVADVEILTPPFRGPSYATKVVSGVNSDDKFPIYPGLHLAPDGRIYYSGTTWKYDSESQTAIGVKSFHVGDAAPKGSWRRDDVTVRYREEGMSVLLPLNPPYSEARILVMGGGYWNNDRQDPRANPKSAEILTIAQNGMRSEALREMSEPRVNGSAVLLPDGTVLVLGGHNSYKTNLNLDYQASLTAQLLDPASKTWTSAGVMSDPRTYHSVALLLPDGRVFVAGGLDPQREEPKYGRPLNLKTREYYKPPYFFKGKRPKLGAVHRKDGLGVLSQDTNDLCYGESFVIDVAELESPGSIEKVVLLRLGCVTHHTDTDQRSVSLAFKSDQNRLLVTMPAAEPYVLPPGHYMLWIVDNRQRPCEEARIVRVSPRKLVFVANKTRFSRGDIPRFPFTFSDPFCVELQGHFADEVDPAKPIAETAPKIRIYRTDGQEVDTIEATPIEKVPVQQPDNVAGRQVFRTSYNLTFKKDSEFPASGLRSLDVVASFGEMHYRQRIDLAV